MLKESNRLKKKKDFEKVFKKGKGFRQDFLVLKIIKNDLKKSRFGFVVGKNFSKKANERNKIKRKLREIVRAKLPEIKKSQDIILVVCPVQKIGSFQEIERIVDKLFKKAKIFDKNEANYS